MEKKTKNGIGLGIFVFIGIALFIAGIYFIGDQKQLFSTTFTIRGLFKDVNGLKVGNNVRFSGINVGVIENIQIVSDTSVLVDMTVDEAARIFIKKNASAFIGSEGLMGNKIMTIMPGTENEEPIKNGDFIRTTVPVSIDEILAKIKITADNAAVISDELADILIKVNSGNGTIGRLLHDSTIAENIDNTIVNLKKSAKGLDENMEAAKHNVLLKRYFNKKKREERRKERALEKEKEKEKEEKAKAGSKDTAKQK